MGHAPIFASEIDADTGNHLLYLGGQRVKDVSCTITSTPPGRGGILVIVYGAHRVKS